MNTTTKAFVIAAILMGTVLVGCHKEMQLTFYNHTDATLPVTVTTPEQGTMSAGAVAGNGSMLIYNIKIKKDLLPANCTATVGSASQTFTVTEAMDDRQFFHLTPQGSLVGPVNEDAEVKVIKQTGETHTTTEGGFIVD